MFLEEILFCSALANIRVLCVVENFHTWTITTVFINIASREECHLNELISFSH